MWHTNMTVNMWDYIMCFVSHPLVSRMGNRLEITYDTWHVVVLLFRVGWTWKFDEFDGAKITQYTLPYPPLEVKLATPKNSNYIQVCK